MLIKISKIFLFCFFIQNLTAQSGEISLNYQLGIAGSRLRTNYNSQDKYSQGKSGTVIGSNWLYDQVFGVEYKHPFIKRWKLFWNFGYEYGVFNRYNNITESFIIYYVAKYKVIRSELHIGLTKRFELKKSKINFDCGFDLSYRQYKFSHIGSSSSELTSSYPNSTVQYEYDIYYENKNFGYSYKPKILNFEWHAKANFPLAKNVYLNVGLRAAFNYFEYQYVNYKINHFDENGNFLYYYDLTSAGAPDQNVGDYFYLTFGGSYRFDWQKVKLFKKSEKD